MKKRVALYVMAAVLLACVALYLVNGEWLHSLSNGLFIVSILIQAREVRS